MKDIDVRKVTGEKYRKHLSYSMSYGAFYAFFILVCFGLAFFLPSTLILTIPLVIIPFTFAFQFNTSIDNSMNEDQGFSLRKFFSLYPVYFRRQFFGAYKIFMGFLKSLGVYFGFYTVAMLCCEPLIYSDPEVVAMISSIEEATNYDGLETTVLNTLMNNATFLKCLYLAMGIALFPALLMFVHHIGTNSLKIHLSVAGGQKMDMREVHMIHRMGFSSFRKSFYKDYFKTVWWFTPCMAVLYYGGMTLSYFFLSGYPYVMGIIGAALAVLFIAFLAPYYFSCIETLFIKYQDKYIEASIDQSVRALNELKARNQMSKEEEEEIEKYISQTKDFLEKSRGAENDSEEDGEKKNSDDSES